MGLQTVKTVKTVVFKTFCDYPHEYPLMVYAKRIYHKIYARFKPGFKANGRLNKMLLNHLCGIYHQIYARFKSIVNPVINYA